MRVLGRLLVVLGLLVMLAGCAAEQSRSVRVQIDRSVNIADGARVGPGSYWAVNIRVIEALGGKISRIGRGQENWWLVTLNGKRALLGTGALSGEVPVVDLRVTGTVYEATTAAGGTEAFIGLTGFTALMQEVYGPVAVPVLREGHLQISTRP